MLVPSIRVGRLRTLSRIVLNLTIRGDHTSVAYESCDFTREREKTVCLTLTSVISGQVLFRRPNILLDLSTICITCESHDRLLEMISLVNPEVLFFQNTLYISIAKVIFKS